jgi:hypothetical protein
MIRWKLFCLVIGAFTTTCGCDKNPPTKQSAINTHRPATPPAKKQLNSTPPTVDPSAKESVGATVAIENPDAADEWRDQQNLKAFAKGYPDYSTNPAPPVKSALTITAEQLCREYATDARAANLKFNRAPALVSGVVLMVQKNQPGEITIAGTDRHCVTVFAAPNAPGELDLRPGHTVKIKGQLGVDFMLADSPHVVSIGEIIVTSRKAPAAMPAAMLSLTGDEFVDQLAKMAVNVTTENQQFVRPVLLCGTVKSTSKSANSKTTIQIAGRDKEITCVLVDPHPIEIKIGQRVNLVGKYDSNGLKDCYFYAGQPVP